MPGALGGSGVDVYVGQVIGPFRLPCHMTYSSTELGPDWKSKVDAHPQCGGAAQLRGALGVKYPEGIHVADPDDPQGFKTLIQFISYHLRCSEGFARDWLNLVGGPYTLLKEQLCKAEVRQIG